MILALLAMVSSQPVYSDPERGVTIDFDQPGPGEVTFSARLPAGWSFVVRVDGDQNGKWGVGAGNPTSMKPTSDVTFGQDGRSGVFCSQSIYTARPEDPDQPYASSDCGEFPSKGDVELGGPDVEGKATITIRLPAEELFGSRSTAWVQACVWDTKRMACQHKLATPLVLTRS